MGRSRFEPANSIGGVNYGWRCYEGNSNFNTNGCNSTYTFPVFDYPHDNSIGGYSITGGYVYRGSAYPELYGNYICTDYASGNFWTISPNDTSDEWIVNRQNGLLTSVSTFGEDINGELYVAKLNTGKIYKLSGDCPDSTIQVAIELIGDSIVSNIVNGQLTWYKDGTELQGQNESSIPLQGEGAYSLEVVVNDNGCHYYGTSNSLSPPVISGVFSQSIKTIQLYPNPASKDIYAVLPIEIVSSLDRVRLVNIEGKQELLNYTLEGNNLNLDISKLSNGVYFLEIIAKGERYLGKVIKE
ncbi:MAG: T9SS type A sorting domain-containing protein [Chitinophagales bacterium]